MKLPTIPLVVVWLGVIWAGAAGTAVSHETISTTVLFDREIVRILGKRCVACHSEANLAFPLMTYEEARPWAASIKQEALRRHMPPWRAVQGYAQFANDNSLTLRELEFLVSWVEGSGPRNAEQKVFSSVAAAPQSTTSVPRPDFAGWHLGAADLRRRLPPQHIERNAPDGIARAVIDLGLTADRWVRALEFKPGDRRMVRAAFFSVEETGQWVGSWTPWHETTTLPAGLAYHIPAGAHIAVEVHYRSLAEDVDVQGELGLYYSSTASPSLPGAMTMQANGEVPPGATRHRLAAQETLLHDTIVIALRPEFRPGIRSLSVTAQQPDGVTRPLLLVKDVLTEWPTPYIYDTPVFLPKGTVLSLIGYYANAGTRP